MPADQNSDLFWNRGALTPPKSAAGVINDAYNGHLLRNVQSNKAGSDGATHRATSPGSRHYRRIRRRPRLSDVHIISHGRYVAFQMAKVAISRHLFADILRLIAELRPPPITSPVRKRRRFVGLVKDAKSNQIGMEAAAIWGMLVEMSSPVTPQYLLEGAVYALEQCGLLLRDADILYRSSCYANAVVLAAFAREELGRSTILFGLRRQVLDGKDFTIEEIRKGCDDHVTKQRAGMLSTIITAPDKESGLGKLLRDNMTAHPQSAESKEADAELAR